MYAESYTAINRLPLQFLPPLVFAATIIAWSRVSMPVEISWIQIIVSASLSAVVVACGLGFVIWKDISDNPTEPIAFKPSQLQFVIGSGHQDSDGVKITGYRNGFAMLSSGPVQLDTESLARLEYSVSAGDGGRNAVFFWRRFDRPTNVVRLELPAGKGLVNLSAQEDWTGQVSELGFLFIEPKRGEARLGSFSLEPLGLSASLGHMADGWFEFEPWSQGSSNYLYGGKRNQKYALPPLMASWLLLALTLGWIWSRGNRTSFAASLVILCLLAWMALDVRSTVNSYRKSVKTIDRFAGLSPQERLEKAMDGPLYHFIEQIKKLSLGTEPARLVVIGNADGDARYVIMRARYHLLPHNALIASQLTTDYWHTKFDYVLFIDHLSGLSLEEISARLPVAEEWRARLRGVSRFPYGILLSVAPPDQDDPGG
jgi:hypothetical protein